MNMDFEQSLSYMAKDKAWGSKLLIGSLVVFGIVLVFVLPFLIGMLASSLKAGIISFVISFVISFILGLALTGYVCVTANNRIKNCEEILPYWSHFGKFMVVGMKYILGYLLYVIPVCVLSIAFLGFLALAVGGSGFEFLSFIFITLLGAATLFVYILTMVFMPMMMSNFMKNLKILSFVDFKEAYTMVKGNVSSYLVLILLFIAMGFLGQVVFSLLAATIIGVILIPVLYFYIYLVMADIIAQFVKTSEMPKE